MCALDADDVGIGGENGSGGYCVTEAWRLMADVAGEIDGGGAGSSSPIDTPRARSLASMSSF